MPAPDEGSDASKCVCTHFGTWTRGGLSNNKLVHGAECTHICHKKMGQFFSMVKDHEILVEKLNHLPRGVYYGQIGNTRRQQYEAWASELNDARNSRAARRPGVCRGNTGVEPILLAPRATPGDRAALGASLLVKQRMFDYHDEKWHKSTYLKK